MSYRLSVKDFQLKKTGASDISTLKILTGTSGTSQIYLGDTAVENVGLIKYNHLTDTFSVNTSSTERFKIDSVGKVTIPNQAIIQGGANIPWTTGKSYSVDDVVLKDGYLIRCLTAHTSGTYATDLQSGYWQLTNLTKNYVTNGNFDIWQRGNSFTAAGYSADKMYLDYVLLATITKGTSSPLAGSTSYLRGTTTGTGAYNLSHVLEGAVVDNLKSKIITASVYIRRNATMSGNFVIAVAKNATADTQSGGTWTTISTATILNANVPTDGSWVRLILSVTVPNDGTANGLKVWLYNTANNAVGSTWDYSQLMLNEGPAPSAFQIAGSSYNHEAALCGSAEDGPLLGYSFPIPQINYVANGNFQLNQRGASQLAGYAFDRWFGATGIGGQTGTATQIATNFQNTKSQYAMRWTNTLAGASGSMYWFQSLESAVSYKLAGKLVTISCKARRAVGTGMNGVRFLFDIYTGAANAAPNSGASSSLQSGTYTLTTTFQTYSFTAFIPANALTVQAIVAFSHTSSANGDACDITDIMLNEGPIVFPYIPYGGTQFSDLLYCQRFCWCPFREYISLAGTTGELPLGVGLAISTTNAKIEIRYPVKMFKAPTLSMSVATSWALTNISGNDLLLTGTPAVVGNSNASGIFNCAVAAGLTAGNGTILKRGNDTVQATFDAEL